ncbi:MAG: hypothetical protein ACREGL_09655 [Alphaproteobacteria bacterium]
MTKRTRVTVMAAVAGALLTVGAAAQTQSTSYRDGHQNGCQHGRQYAGGAPAVDRNEGRFAAEVDYAAGWKAGLAECYEKYRRISRIGSGVGGR